MSATASVTNGVGGARTHSNDDNTSVGAPNSVNAGGAETTSAVADGSGGAIAGGGYSAVSGGGSSGTVAGTVSSSTGAGGAPELEGPRFELSVGRLVRDPQFCWVKQAGKVDKTEWLAKREHFQQWISSWQGASGLEIQWLAECAGEGAPQEHVRILLDDRELTHDTIPGCDHEDQTGPWAVYPIEAGEYDRCEWNMVLPFDLDEPRTVLHVAGHALGFSHEHLREVWPVPDCPDELTTDPTNPYLETYDAYSVMHYGHLDEVAFDGTPWATCTDATLGGLTAGDLLGIEMLYPPNKQVPLGGTGWLPFGDALVIRNKGRVSLVNAWVRRGASLHWFKAHFWTITTPVNPIPEILDDLQIELSPQSGGIWYVSHMFTDPFGENHQFLERVEVSDEKHTAVLLSFL